MLLAASALAAMLALAVSAGAAVHDVTLVSRASGPGGAAANANSRDVAISNSGRFVAFVSEAELAPGAATGIANVYRRDSATRETVLISRASGLDGVGADADSASPALSPGGRYVAFESSAANLSADDVDPVTDVFLRDTKTGATTLISRGDGDAAPGGDAGSHNPAIALYGDHVVFESDADNLHPEAAPTVRNIFVRDMKSQTVKLVSRGSPTFDAPEGPPAERRLAQPLDLVQRRPNRLRVRRLQSERQGRGRRDRRVPAKPEVQVGGADLLSYEHLPQPLPACRGR